MKGQVFTTVKAAIMIGAALAGLVLALITLTQMKIETDYNIYAKGFQVLSMPYKARLLMIYVNESRQEIKQEQLTVFLKIGGPRYCGSVNYGGNKVSVWVNEETECDYRKMSHDLKEKLIDDAWREALCTASSRILRKPSVELGTPAKLREGELTVNYYSKTIEGNLTVNRTSSFPESLNPDILSPLLNDSEKEQALERIEEVMEEGDMVMDSCADGRRTIVKCDEDEKVYVAEILKC